MPRYFAYGSNLCLRQMRQRCPGALVVAAAVLPRYRLDFVQPHDGWGGGVAGVVPANDRVEGIVYRLSHDDLAALDGHEPVAQGRYWRERARVLTHAGNALSVWVYFGQVFPDAPYTPSAKYLGTLLRGAREHGLNTHYIDNLRAAVR